MAKLNIPARNREGISKLLALEPEQFDAFVAALESQPPSVNLISELSTSIKLPDVSSSNIEKITSAVIGLHLVRASREATANEFVQAVAQAIASFDANGQLDSSKARLLKIININSLVISAKAVTIQMDRERTMYPFC